MTSRRTPVAVALTALALTAPVAAQARPTAEPGWRALTEQEQQVLASRGQGAPDVRSQPAPVVVAADPGFDWTAAALGAGGGIAIATLAAFGVGAAGQRRVRAVR